MEAKLALFQTEDSVGGPQTISVASQRASRGVVRVGWKITKLWGEHAPKSRSREGAEVSIRHHVRERVWESSRHS